MNQEENILQLILEKESWEEVIYHIVSVENLDPWNIDLVKLTSKFIEYIQKVKELDFRIPAKIVFVAVVLLRLKADYLSIFEEEESIEELAKEKPFVDLGIDPNLIELGVPLRRVPKRQVTLNELINALRKALAVKERREERKALWKKRVIAQIGEEDIARKIEHVLKEIETAIQKSKREKIEFRSIVEEWKREKIVEHFVPLLHLEQNRKIRTEQEDWFKEIWISKLD